MRLSKEHIDIYNEYLRFINEVNKEIKSVKSIQKNTLRKDEKATEEEILALEEGKIIEENEEVKKKK
ncbi:hypothetical protein [[Clostridium] dakarense]|uniref:hypothetical protein n=1 Tax=Faecalimicrobium dakarense TaxID=1301100 RepID=UPI0004B7CCB3|nr:hypothetical protein [[Clostridium] dakarense]